jgi:hypothetical protein
MLDFDYRYTTQLVKLVSLKMNSKMKKKISVRILLLCTKMNFRMTVIVNCFDLPEIRFDAFRRVFISTISQTQHTYATHVYLWTQHIIHTHAITHQHIQTYTHTHTHTTYAPPPPHLSVHAHQTCLNVFV